jgi:hypothetical protein
MHSKSTHTFKLIANDSISLWRDTGYSQDSLLLIIRESPDSTLEIYNIDPTALLYAVRYYLSNVETDRIKELDKFMSHVNELKDVLDRKFTPKAVN